MDHPIPFVQTLGKPLRTSMLPVWLNCRCCSDHKELVFLCSHGVFWASSENLGPDLAAGSSFVSGLYNAAWDAFCVQPPGTLWKILMCPVWWRCRSNSQHFGLLFVCSHGVLSAAQIYPPVNMRGLFCVLSLAL